MSTLHRRLLFTFMIVAVGLYSASIYADENEGDFNRLLFIKESGHGGYYAASYLERDDKNHDSKKGKGNRIRWTVTKIFFQGKNDLQEKKAWIKGGRRLPKPPSFHWNIKSVSKGPLTTDKIDKIKEAVRTIGQSESKVYRSRSLMSGQGYGYVLVGSDDKFKLHGASSPFPLTREYIKKMSPETDSYLTSIGYQITAIDEAYLQIRDILFESASNPSQDTPIGLALFLLENIPLIGEDEKHSGPDHSAVEISHQLRVRLKVDIRQGTLSEKQGRLVDRISNAFKGSTTKHKRVEIKSLGTGVAEKKIKGDLTDYEMKLLDQLVTDIEIKGAVIDIRIDAKFKKQLGESKNDRDDFAEGRDDD